MRVLQCGRFVALAVAVLVAGGCAASPQLLRQSQLRAWQLYQQNKQLALEAQQARQLAETLQAEKEQCAQRAQQLQSELEVTKKRLENLLAERSQLHQRYVSLLNSKNPMSAESTRRFEELAKRFPEFEFDPVTGVSKFKADILFDSGSAELKPEALPVLREFAKLINQGDAKMLNLLIVGHTDDRPIVKPSTKRKHPTNGHLSTNRAHAVRMALQKFGVDDARMGVAGYGPHHPLVPNVDEESRAKNRRVEIFVLAPDAAVAGWDPATSRN